jgi:S1/P1 Nuclease
MFSQNTLCGRLRRSVLPWLLLLSLIFPQEAGAWGNSGHESVAFIAWQQLTPATKTRVMALLKLVPTLQSPDKTKSIPGFTEWVADLPAGLSKDQQNQFLFMRAATWADSIKHQFLKDSDTPPPGLASEKPVGYADTASHGYWHFVDHGFASDTSTVPATPTPNAATQIAVLRAGIASSGPDTLKSYELVWLEHLVGDAHQPLHGAVRINGGKGDEGGNTVKIKMPAAMKKLFEGTVSKSAPTELHAFWDDLPGEGGPAPALPFAASFAKPLPAAPASDVAKIDPAGWAQESFTLATKDAYAPPIGKTATSSHTITQAYFDTAMQDAKDRIALAGARLAKLLNENLK